MGEGDAKLGIENEPSVMEDLFESIIGAVYIDSDMNMPTVMQVVSRMLDLNGLTAKEPPLQSAKNALQEYCQDKSRRLPPPRYETLSEDGPDHKKQYRRGVFVGDRLVAEGVGKNLKLADAAAAEAALAVLKKENDTKKKEAADTKSSAQAANPSTSAPSAKNVKKTTKVDTAAETKKAKQSKDTPNNSARPTPKAKKVATTAKVTSKNFNAPATPKATEKNEPKPQTPLQKKGSKPSAASTQKKSARQSSASAGKSAPTATAGLKSHAAQKKIATPTFKDLGESREGGRAVYRVECIFMGRSATGVGTTRPEAKENAARLILDSMRGAKAKKKK
jgi:dsRNA-specific ribonuclease